MAKHFTPRRQELCAWLTANGIDPNVVPVDADLTISTGPDGTRRIHYEAHVRNENGRITLNERGDNPAIEKLSVPLIVDPPVWWHPHVKPTREQLLARAERVRALHRRNENTAECEYCSARDYPGYAVPFPCGTIRALDGQDQPDA
jgi:hypothetical protein